MAALGIAHAAVEPQFGDVSKIAGGLAFGLALVFLVVGRTELFNENFFDPTAAAVDNDDSWMVGPLVRLWALTFVFNFVGAPCSRRSSPSRGAPAGTAEALVSTAEDIVARSPLALFASAVFGGALVSLSVLLLQAVDSDGARITLSYMVGFLLALGPFDHVVVSVLHVYFGMLFGGPIGYGALLVTMAVSTAGNFVGGLGLVTVSHVAQVKGPAASPTEWRTLADSLDPQQGPRSGGEPAVLDVLERVPELPALVTVDIDVAALGHQYRVERPVGDQFLPVDSGVHSPLRDALEVLDVELSVGIRTLRDGSGHVEEIRVALRRIPGREPTRRRNARACSSAEIAAASVPWIPTSISTRQPHVVIVPSLTPEWSTTWGVAVPR